MQSAFDKKEKRFTTTLVKKRIQDSIAHPSDFRRRVTILGPIAYVHRLPSLRPDGPPLRVAERRAGEMRGKAGAGDFKKLNRVRNGHWISLNAETPHHLPFQRARYGIRSESTAVSDLCASKKAFREFSDGSHMTRHETL